MRRRTKGLAPHEEKIVLTKPDKIIFLTAAAIYAAAVLVEEKSGYRNAVSSSFAIMAVGIFLISKGCQKIKGQKLLALKDKIITALMLLGGAVFAVAGLISLIFDIIELLK